MKNFVQIGDDVTVTAPYALSTGQGALVGTLFGVAKGSALISASVVLCTKGVFDLAKKPADAPTAGALLYWDDTNKYVTVTAASNKVIGCALKAAAGADATVRVRLNGIAV